MISVLLSEPPASISKTLTARFSNKRDATMQFAEPRINDSEIAFHIEPFRNYAIRRQPTGTRGDLRAAYASQ
jgi:hypothetical protein